MVVLKCCHWRRISGCIKFCLGVYPEYSAANYDVLIGTRHTMELYGIGFDPVIMMGANLPLHNLWELFDRTKTGVSIPYGCAAIAIRNMACWAGNLMQPDSPSDLYLLFESIGCSLILILM